MRRMIFDVESVGLYGEHFAVAYLLAEANRVLEEGLMLCNPETAMGDSVDLRWVEKNVFPWIHAMSLDFPGGGHAKVMTDPTTGALTHLCSDTGTLRKAFWHLWARERVRETELWADVTYPVEAGFLAACVRDDRTRRKFEGPYPLLDISTAVRLAGPRMSKLTRVPSELPEHHPLMDTRFSFRQLLTALSALGVEA